jgi:hypothetical protein
MPVDATDVFATDLPLVRREFPWPVRVGCIAAGAFAVVMTLWELGPGLWPLNIATPFFAIIIGGAGYVGVQFIRAGLSGWGDVWTYPRDEIHVQRRAWGRHTTTRLSTANVSAVEVRRSEDADHDDAPLAGGDRAEADDLGTGRHRRGRRRVRCRALWLAGVRRARARCVGGASGALT